MDTKYFKCTLKSDIVINASLATEGNMRTLDYIPGSNFLGIVAGKLYKKWDEVGRKTDLMNIFHSSEVSFGDGHISIDKKNKSYALPFSLFKDKLGKELTDESTKIWVHHYLHKDNLPKKKDEEGNYKKIQFKQLRSGYFDKNLYYLPKINKRFALKSAQNREKRRSKDEAMYGFDSMQKRQVFIFSVNFSDKIVPEIKTAIIEALIGENRIGKSKSAQYGQVSIQAIEGKDIPKGFEHDLATIRIAKADDTVAIYAASNLCFLNEYGQATFQPKAAYFGIEGVIDWSLSQIRTYSYSPWNGHRNTTDTQRACILKGSVIIVKLSKTIEHVDKLPKMVGEYQAEGLGRIILNPNFLIGDNLNGLWTLRLNEYPSKKNILSTQNGNTAPTEIQSDLGKLLNKRQQKLAEDLAIGKAVLAFLNGMDEVTNRSHKSIFENISTSQWGSIRAKAIQKQHSKNSDKDLIQILEEMLSNGVAAERYWDKNKGLPRKILLDTIKKYKEDRDKFLAKFTVVLATEMTEYKQKMDKNRP